ncbi:hypothetical protein [Microlunatus parietis]|uniref:Uncharacterized protein n=1 Tax=Microlunatus parietis TaxID=682979 RepID=A0A7Y9IEZ4_9ACTN|nr:hypothetical protein [Microlunatus parietis]NYE75609.1 hypothetical protein [Microlunatus parietis]
MIMVIRRAGVALVAVLVVVVLLTGCAGGRVGGEPGRVIGELEAALDQLTDVYLDHADSDWAPAPDRRPKVAGHYLGPLPPSPKPFLEALRGLIGSQR